MLMIALILYGTPRVSLVFSHGLVRHMFVCAEG